MADPETIRVARTIDWILVALFVATSVLFISLLLDLPPRATIFPWFVSVTMVLVALVYSAGNLRNPARWDDKPAETGDDEETAATAIGIAALKGRGREIFRMFAAVYIFGGAIMLVGHLVAVPLFILAYVLYRRESWVLAVGGAVVFFVLIQLVFIEGMDIVFPEPMLLRWFGG